MRDFRKKILVLLLSYFSFSFSVFSSQITPLFDNVGTTGTKNHSVKKESDHAQEDTNFFYLGIKAGSSYYQNACEPWATYCNHRDPAFGGFIGYRFHNNFSAEASYLDLGEVNALYPESGLLQAYTGTVSSWELAVAYDVSLTNKVAAFFKLSAINWSAENRSSARVLEDDGWSPAGEVGLTYQLSEKWQTRLSYQYINGLGSDKVGGSNGHIAWFGITYQFKSSRSLGKATIKPPAKPPVTKIVGAKSAKVEFAFDSIEFKPTQALNSIVRHAVKYPQINIFLQTHTDSVGDKVYNQKLSERRAQSILKLLVSRGISKERIFVSAYGEAAPVSDNLSAQHRRLNHQAIISTNAFDVIDEGAK